MKPVFVIMMGIGAVYVCVRVYMCMCVHVIRVAVMHV